MNAKELKKNIVAIINGSDYTSSENIDYKKTKFLTNTNDIKINDKLIVGDVLSWDRSVSINSIVTVQSISRNHIQIKEGKNNCWHRITNFKK